MQNVDGTQTATGSWTTVSGMTIDCNSGNETRLTYFFEASTNDVNVQVQGSVNNINWITLQTRDLMSVDQQNYTIVVPAGGSAVAVISPEDLNGINSGFQYYRVQIQGSSPYGSIQAWGDAK
jgi:hypothetical protein